MSINNRILMECRYLLSLNKTYDELASILNVSKSTVCNDLNSRLYNFDKELYNRVKKVIKNKECK